MRLTYEGSKRLNCEAGPQNNEQVCLRKVLFEVFEEARWQAFSKEDNVRLHQSLCSEAYTLNFSILQTVCSGDTAKSHFRE